MLFKLLCFFLSASLLIGCLGCSPGYVFRAAYEESLILLAREPIDLVISDPKTPEEVRSKLHLVKEARKFAEQIGLDPKCSFTKYTEVDRDVLAWVLMASKRDAFELKSWWFPIVGSVPYKGFFDREDAEALGLKLRSEGYEGWIRPTEAFSTLGWFNDPILSTTLKNSDSRIADTVIHESVHSTVWIGGSVPFNESLANFIGMHGAIEFFRQRIAQCGDDECTKRFSAELEAALRNRDLQIELSSIVDRLYSELDRLYSGPGTSEEKIAARDAVFEEVAGEFRSRYPNYVFLQQLNNAAILQLRIYLMEMSLFERYFKDSGGDLRTFLSNIREIVSEGGDRDPFEVLKSRLADRDG